MRAGAVFVGPLQQQVPQLSAPPIAFSQVRWLLLLLDLI
jgi:hypothetical protein